MCGRASGCRKPTAPLPGRRHRGVWRYCAQTGRRVCRPGPHGVGGRLPRQVGGPSMPSTMPSLPERCCSSGQKPGRGNRGRARSSTAATVGRGECGGSLRGGAGRRMATGRLRSGGGANIGVARAGRRLQRWRNSGLEKGFQLGYPQEQHERLAVRIGPEAEAFVERPGLSVDGLHDDGARADQVGRRQGAPRRVDQQV